MSKIQERKEDGYMDLYDLLQTKYGATNEQILHMLSLYPELDFQYKAIGIIDKFELLKLYDVTFEQAINNPQFLRRHISSIEINCMLAKLAGQEIDGEFLSQDIPTYVANAILYSKENNILANDIDIFETAENAAKMLNMSEEEFLYNQTQSIPKARIRERFKAFDPELYEKSRAITIPAGKTQLKKVDIRKKQLKAEIQNYFSERAARGISIKKKVPIVRNETENLVYSSEPTVIFENQITIDETMSDENFDELVNQVSEYYQIDKETIKAKYELCKTLYGLSRDEFITKLETNNHLIAYSDQKLLHSANQLKTIYSSKQHDVKLYVLAFDNFPELRPQQTVEKIEQLQKLGIEKEYVLKDPNILKIDIERLTTRAQLAYLNNVSVDYFMDRGFKVPEELITSRLKAKEEGFLPKETKLYTAESEILKLTNLNSAQMLEKYPFTQEDFIKINYAFAEKTKDGINWPKYKKTQTKKSDSYNTNFRTFKNDATISDDEVINSRIIEIAKHYNVPMSYIEKRQRLCEELFGLKKEDFLYRLNFIQKIRQVKSCGNLYDNLITSTDSQLYKYKDNTAALGMNADQILKLAKTDAHFPYYPYDTTNAKIEKIIKFGPTREEVLNNFDMIYIDPSRLETRFKIAFIKNCPIDKFLSKKYYKQFEDYMYARMEANRKKYLPKATNIYLPEQVWKEQTGYSTQELSTIFPYNDAAQTEINELYNYFVFKGREWRRLPKQDEFGDVDFENEPLITLSEDLDEILTDNTPEIENVTQENMVQTNIQPENKDENSLSAEQILKLCTMFDCSPNKLQTLMKDKNFVAFCKENLKTNNEDEESSQM